MREVEEHKSCGGGGQEGGNVGGGELVDAFEIPYNLSVSPFKCSD